MVRDIYVYQTNLPNPYDLLQLTHINASDYVFLRFDLAVFCFKLFALVLESGNLLLLLMISLVACVTIHQLIDQQPLVVPYPSWPERYPSQFL